MHTQSIVRVSNKLSRKFLSATMSCFHPFANVESERVLDTR